MTTAKDQFLQEVLSKCADVLEKHIEQIEADLELDSPQSSMDSAASEHGSNIEFLRRIYDRVSADGYSSWNEFFGDIQALHAAARKDTRGKNVLNAVRSVLVTAERLWKNSETGNSEKANREANIQVTSRATQAPASRKRKRDEEDDEDDEDEDVEADDDGDVYMSVDDGRSDDGENENNVDVEDAPDDDDDEEESSFVSVSSDSDFEYGRSSQRRSTANSVLSQKQAFTTIKKEVVASPSKARPADAPPLIVRFKRAFVEEQIEQYDSLYIRLPNPNYLDRLSRQRPNKYLLTANLDKRPKQEPTQYYTTPSQSSRRRQSEPAPRVNQLGSRTSNRTPQGPSKRLKTQHDGADAVLQGTNKFSTRLNSTKMLSGAASTANELEGASSVLDWNDQGAAVILSATQEVKRAFDDILIELASSAPVDHKMGTAKKRQVTEEDIDLSKEMLGSGKFAQVYRGTMQGQPVAVKCFIPSAATDSDFDSEVVKLSNLVHTNIVEYLGFVPAPTMWIVMELMDRGSLFHVINEERPQKVFSWSERTRMAREVCSAMEYLHSHGIRHCDLNSKNLLVNYAYSVKVADFGLSQDAEDDASGALVGKHFGTLRWMCPEMIRKDCKSMEKADVWSYGVVMMEIATQEVPYPTFVEADVKYQVSRGNGPTASDPKIWAHCPGWKIIMESCFHSDYIKRPTFMQLSKILKILHEAYNY